MKLSTLGAAFCLLLCGSVRAGSDETGAAFSEIRRAAYSPRVAELAQRLLAHASGACPVSEYGRMVQGRGAAGADEVTVDSELYWMALFSVGWADPSIHLVRMYLLMSEGRLEQAANTLSFAVPSALAGDGEGLASINAVWADLTEQFAYYDAIWSRGVALHDKGNFRKALDRYDEVLADNPRYCPALTSKGVTLAVMEQKGYPAGSLQQALGFLAEARAANPFYAEAYQGTPADAAKNVIVSRILAPVVGAVRTGDSRSVDLLRFAKGCVLIEAPDYAIYALWVDVGQKLAAGRAVEEEIQTIGQVLEGKAMGQAASFFREAMKVLRASR